MNQPIYHTVIVWDDNGTDRVIRDRHTNRQSIFAQVDTLSHDLEGKIKYGMLVTDKQASNAAVLSAKKAIARSREGRITAFFLPEDWRECPRPDVLIFNTK